MANEKTLNDQIFWLAYDGGGTARWYINDPSFAQDRKEIETDIATEVTRFLGETPTVLAPAKVRFKAVLQKGVERFSISVPDDIRAGVLKQIIDLEGNIVEITAKRNNDPRYPMNGVVFDADGATVALRKYSTAGECSDGDERHSLVVRKVEQAK